MTHISTRLVKIQIPSLKIWPTRNWKKRSLKSLMRSGRQMKIKFPTLGKATIKNHPRLGLPTWGLTQDPLLNLMEPKEAKRRKVYRIVRYVSNFTNVQKTVSKSVNTSKHKSNDQKSQHAHEEPNRRPSLDPMTHVIETFRYFDQRRSSKESIMNHLRDSSKEIDK